ncbi:MAG: amidohydrolase [Acidobacteria bacterium]|nr:amidohydrolase [Acidobacteriota bacterium]
MPRNFLLAILLGITPAAAQTADLILYNGKIVTVDAQFHIAQAVAIRGERILEVGANAAVRKLAGAATSQVDLKSRTVLPGLIDTHVHSVDAAMYEFDHPVPEMETIADVLNYIGSRAGALPEGQWIFVSQVFITRLRDQRFPTRDELDRIAPRHPVYFRTGPDASLNSLALKLSGIDRNFRIQDGLPGRIEREPKTGEPTGILRNCSRFVKYKPAGKSATGEDRRTHLRQLLADYNATGITSIADRDAGDDDLDAYRRSKEHGELTCRVFVSLGADAQMPLEKIEARIRAAAQDPLHRYNNQLWLRGIKVYLDGGMLTGSAYMRQPWGVSRIYAIDDPDYRGMRYIEPGKLYRIAKLALENDLQMTAHSVGDGAVHALIEAYEEIDKGMRVRERRPCISHSNFMSLEAIQKMKALGIVADLQPAWLWLDGATLAKQFGYGRLQYFQPYKTLFDQGVTIGGGSDHMQKVGSLRSINPYNPFLGMWITIVRQPRWTDQPLHPEQRITREQAIRLYTINNAFLTFEEKEKGSLEKGKLADLIVLNRDILTCPADEIRNITVDQTYLGGKLVFSR